MIKIEKGIAEENSLLVEDVAFFTAESFGEEMVIFVASIENDFGLDLVFLRVGGCHLTTIHLEDDDGSRVFRDFLEEELGYLTLIKIYTKPEAIDITLTIQ